MPKTGCIICTQLIVYLFRKIQQNHLLHFTQFLELLMRIELTTSSLPRKCSTTEPQRPFPSRNWSGRRGSNSPPIAWKAIALPNELLPRFVLPKRTQIQTSHTIFYAIYIKFGGQSRVRTYVLVREQIYSLSPLTTRPSAQDI